MYSRISMFILISNARVTISQGQYMDECQRLGIEALAWQEEDVLDFEYRKNCVGFVDSRSALTQL